MSRILELSQKIYEAGFTPDLREFNQILYPSSDGEYESAKPYFSADWCWGILPRELELEKENCDLRISDFYVSYCYDEYLDTYFLGKTFEIKNSLHEALLEMVCWCIENGYIKKEVEE